MTWPAGTVELYSWTSVGTNPAAVRVAAAVARWT